MFIQPPVGAWSDRLRTPIGRRMPFILIGAPVGALAFGLIPLAAVLPLFVACTSTLLLSMAFWRTPVVALMPDITPSPFRSQANGIINLMGGVGTIIASLVGSTLYEINLGFPILDGLGAGDCGRAAGLPLHQRAEGIRGRAKSSRICSPACANC